MDIDGLDIRIEDMDGVRHVYVGGEVDIANVDQLNAALQFQPVDGGSLVVDTTQLTFIGCAGLGALIATRNTLGLNAFSLLPGHRTTRLLELSELHTFFGLGEYV